MQCPSCRAVYSNGLEICPRCKTPAPPPPVAETESAAQVNASPELTTHPEEFDGRQASALPDSPTDAQPTAAAPPVSTLIEFPGVSRNKPQWRKDLSERVREIQERRARDSTRDSTREVAPNINTTPQHPAGQPAATQLGLVPQPDAPAVNPIVVAALKRLERARQTTHVSRTRGGGAATAVARVTEEHYQLEETRQPELAALSSPALEPEIEQLPEEQPAEAVREREHMLVVVPPPAPPVKATAAATVRIGSQFLSLGLSGADSHEELGGATFAASPAAEPYDDRASITMRAAGAFVDLLVVAFASSPFAAIIELTNGNWSDIRVMASMCGIIATIMFMYLAASTALAGRTWGMSLLSIRAVDADTGLPPTTKQAVGRALLYMLSLACFGLGILYALFDAEGRTAHDHLSGTAVIRD